MKAFFARNAQKHQTDFNLRSVFMRILGLKDRIEMISLNQQPSILTPGETMAHSSDILAPILASFSAKHLSYCDLGSGLKHALRIWPYIEPINDRAGNVSKDIAARHLELAT